MTGPMGKTSSKPQHAVLLSHDEKVEWFTRNITERQRVQPFESEEQLLGYLRDLRVSFKKVYQRDVPGYFIRKMAEKCGISVSVAPKTRVKMNYAFGLMDHNANYRCNKSDLVRALRKKFGEETLNYIVDDIFDEWHDRDDHPDAAIDVDICGQQSLFDDD